MVFVSTVTNLNYPTIDFILPIQIDIIIRFNDDMKIASYDATWVGNVVDFHTWLTYSRSAGSDDGQVQLFFDIHEYLLTITMQRLSNIYYQNSPHKSQASWIRHTMSIKQIQPHCWHFEPLLTFVKSLLNIALATTCSTNRACRSYVIKLYFSDEGTS